MCIRMTCFILAILIFALGNILSDNATPNEETSISQRHSKISIMDADGVSDGCDSINNCGDVNCDSGINVGDAVYMINYIFHSGPGPVQLCMGDCNGDGSANIGDVVHLVNHIFRSDIPPLDGCCLTIDIYTGQTPPGEAAEPFAPAVLIYEPHDSPVISPDEKWFLFHGMEVAIIFYGMVDGQLSVIENPLGFEPPSICNGVAMSPSGNRLYIEEWSDGQAHVYYIDKDGDDWTPPIYVDLGSGINLWQMSVASSGNLYVASDRLMVSTIEGGTHALPVPLKLEDDSDMPGCTPFISPDESYIIYNIDGNLHISYSQTDGKWTTPINLGPNINSSALDMCPQISPNCKYLFFNTRRESNDFVIYWADAGFVEDLRPKNIK